MSMNNSTVIDLASIDDDDEYDFPPPSGLKKTSTAAATAPSAVHATGNISTSIPTQSRVIATKQNDSRPSSRHTVITPLNKTNACHTNTTNNFIQPPKKKAKPSKAYSLIWVCTHGKGRNRNWRKKDLQIMGTYSSMNEAELAKQKLMSQYECCGHGDILVGDTWDDEIDLVIREAPLFLESL